MAARFVAPSPEPYNPKRHSLANAPSSISKRDYLPPPTHPALTRPRSVTGPDSIGVLNRASHSPSPSPWPVPPLPHRRSPGPSPTADQWTGRQTLPAISPPQNTLSNGESDPILPTPTPTVSLLSTEASPPTVLVTPVVISDSNDILDNEPALWKEETVPPYRSQPNLPSQILQLVAEPSVSWSGIPDLGGLSGGHVGLGPQFQGNNPISGVPRTPPPQHPNRQPSPSPSSINALVFRHRTQSSIVVGSAIDPSASTQIRPEPLRRGSGASVLTLNNANLTNDQLRTMYDAEEMERYLRLFASRVNEVAIDPDHPDLHTPACEDDEDWTTVSNHPLGRTNSLPPHLANPRTPFEFAAALVYPYIAQQPRPPRDGSKRKFKLTRASSAAQRLYLAVYPAYVPTLIYLWHLSTWRNPRQSALWCAIYWIAWACGLLSPLVVGRLLYALISGGTVTREEIRRKREAAKEAEKLGKAIKGGIPGVGMSGELGFWEVTKLVTGVGKKRGKKVKAAAEQMSNPTGGQLDGVDAEDVEDWKVMLVDLAEELADLHERIKNIFLHRRPEVTSIYIILLGLLFVGTLVVQNTSKFVTFGLGFWFWFVPPVIQQLPGTPAPFSEAPTDAEVAMELISRRVARGERVTPERIPKRPKRKTNVTDSKLGLTSQSTLDGTESSLRPSPSMLSLVDDGFSTDDEHGEAGLVVPVDASNSSPSQEDKVRASAVNAWNWVGRAMKYVDDARGVKGSNAVHASPEQSFPAQHGSRPGMLMITSTSLTFNPLFPSNASTPSGTAQDTKTIKVDIQDLRGVRKTSLGGLVVRFVKGGAVVEERFLFVVGRDEAFARLVGWGGARWKNV